MTAIWHRCGDATAIAFSRPATHHGVRHGRARPGHPRGSGRGSLLLNTRPDLGSAATTYRNGPAVSLRLRGRRRDMVTAHSTGRRPRLRPHPVHSAGALAAASRGWSCPQAWRTPPIRPGGRRSRPSEGRAGPSASAGPAGGQQPVQMLLSMRSFCSRIARSSGVSPDDWGAPGRGTVAPVDVR